MLEVEGLQLRVPGFQLGPLSLHVREGEYFVLLGPSGSGKTTLLEWMAGFRSADAGSLRIDGSDHSHTKARERGLGVVYQDSALFPHLSVRENIAYALRHGQHGQHGQRARDGHAQTHVRQRVAELAALLRIEALLDADVTRLSGGEQRRVAIARALAAERRILLLDEPLTALDPALHRDIRQQLAALHRRLGLTVLHITHQLTDARSLATRMGVLVGGKLEQVGTPEALFARPDNARVAEALSVANFVAGEADAGGALLRVGQGLELPAPVTTAGRVRGTVRGLHMVSGQPSAQRRPATFIGFERPARGGTIALVRMGPSRADRADRADRATDNAATLELECECGSDADGSAGAGATPEPGADVLVDFSRADWQLY